MPFVALLALRSLGEGGARVGFFTNVGNLILLMQVFRNTPLFQLRIFMIYAHIIALYTKILPLYSRNKWSKYMNHMSLLANFFLLSTQPSRAMEIPQKNNPEPSYATEMCLSGITDRDLERVKRGLQAGADVNYIHHNGSSLFALAAQENKFKDCDSTRKASPFLKLLVSQKNIDPFTKNFNNCTPLHVACQFGVIETINEIVKKAPQVINAQTKQGHTPLHAAVFFGQIEAMRQLLIHDKKIINIQDYEGNTVLHMACKEKQFEIIELLIDNGALSTIKNNRQETAWASLCLYGASPEDIKNINDFFNKNRSIARKLILSTDENNNNQLHLCATLELFDKYQQFDEYLLFLIVSRVSVHARNKQGKKPIDLAFDEYYNAYQQYLSCKTESRKQILINTEKLLHVFLYCIAPFTECILFKNILDQQDEYKLSLAQDIKAYIAYLYYALNIETIVAEKHGSEYYNNCIENKMAIKQELLKNPEPHLLWNAAFNTYFCSLFR